MIRLPPRTTPTDTLVPYTTLCRSQSVLRETPEQSITQRLPDFVNVDDDRCAVDHIVDAPKDIVHQRRPDRIIVEEIGHVEAREPGVEFERVGLIVENPAQFLAARPPLQARPDPVEAGLVELRAHGRQRAGFLRQTIDGLERRIELIQVLLPQLAVIR